MCLSCSMCLVRCNTSTLHCTWTLGAPSLSERQIRPGVDGLSDHSGEPLTAALATYAGAVAVEVHVTFDRRTGLPDARASLTLDQLAEAKRLMTLASEAKTGLRPTVNPESRLRYGYALREGVWCKPA